MTINDLLPLLRNVKGGSGQYSACCPAHEDGHASLSISENDGKILLNCHAGCSVEEITGALGLTPSDLFHDTRTSSAPADPTEYIYHDNEGKPILKKLRYPNKAFCWYYMTDSGGWTKGRNKIEPPLYNQYQCRQYDKIYIVEGEKDVQTLQSLGKCAVSLPDGAKSKWKDSYTEYFKDKTVAILPDNDEPGRAYAEMIVKNISEVATVKIIDLKVVWDDMPEHGDITDYINRFGEDAFGAVTELANKTEPERAESGIITLDDVESRETQWLWYPYIPLGKITLLTADPGTGKTFFSLYIAAVTSTGRPFFGQTEHREPMKVIYQTAEDGIADTIKPRLEPMQPNFKNIMFIDETEKTLSLSDNRLEKIVARYRPALIIFDPLQAYLGAKIDMHRANEVRPIMARIGHIAEQYNAAVIFIMHNSKMSQNKAMHRALGTIDIPAVARSMLMMGKDPEDSKQKLICHEKSSLAAHGDTIKLHIDPANGGIVFDGFSDLCADDILNVVSKTRNKPSPKKDEVKELILQILNEGQNIGSATKKQIETLVYANGYSERTMYNAKSESELQTVQVGYENKVTWWILPEVDKERFTKWAKEQYNLEQEAKQLTTDDGFAIPDDD